MRYMIRGLGIIEEEDEEQEAEGIGIE